MKASKKGFHSSHTEDIPGFLYVSTWVYAYGGCQASSYRYTDAKKQANYYVGPYEHMRDIAIMHVFKAFASVRRTYSERV